MFSESFVIIIVLDQTAYEQLVTPHIDLSSLWTKNGEKKIISILRFQLLKCLVTELEIPPKLRI